MILAGTLPLAGRRIVVTRPREHAAPLAGLLQAEGAAVVLLPTVDIVPIEPGDAMRGVARDLDSFDLAIFVSRTAVREGLFQLDALRGGRPWPAGLRVATVGQGTRKDLQARGFPSVIAPEGAADSEALLALPELTEVRDKRIALFRGEGGRTLIADTLSARGAQVSEAPCYRRSPPADAQGFLSTWSKGPVDAVTVSSGEGLAHLDELLAAGGVPLAETPLFLPHARVAALARARGLDRTIVAGTSDAQVRDALVAYFSPTR